MRMNQITYAAAHGKQPVTLPVGRDYSVTREGACLDICLSRVVAIDCPLVVTILIRTTGEIVLWHTEWDTNRASTYWHFAALSDDSRPLTESQRSTLERMWLGLSDLPGGLDGALTQPVARWAFAGQTPVAIAAKHKVPAPLLM